MIVSIPDLSRFASAGRSKNFSKIVREATTSATETARKTSVCAARLPTPSIAMIAAASAPTPNQSRKNPDVKISAATKMAAMISQINQACDIKFRTPVGFGRLKDYGGYQISVRMFVVPPLGGKAQEPDDSG